MPRLVARRVIGAVFAAALVAGGSIYARQPAAEIHVLTSGAFTAAHLELASEFERREVVRVVTDATSMGTGDTSIEARLARGERADVVIVDADALRRLAGRGLVVAGSRVDLARSSIGMAVRQGAARPDISTVDALRRTLLAATSIAYSASVSGRYLSTELFQQLGIADQVLPKSRQVVGERVGAVVARGEAAIGFQQVSELVPEPGIDYVGPLPTAVQRVTVFAAGVGARALNPEAARRYIAFLGSTAAADAIEKAALEPVASRRPALIDR